MDLPENKKLYFASDFHLGLPGKMGDPTQREQYICQWLDAIKTDAHTIFLVGDIFDVWFEYKNVVPKGSTRFLGKLAELTDSGIKIVLFTGNHDFWMRDYFPQEMNIPVHHEPLEFEVRGKKFFVAHGDGLGPGDKGYKFLKKVLNNPMAKWLYRRVHPDTGMALANYFSKKGKKGFESIPAFKGQDKEMLILFCKGMLQKEAIDYFIFGHRHLALEIDLGQNSRYLNLGDWINYYSYASFDGNELKLLYYKG